MDRLFIIDDDVHTCELLRTATKYLFTDITIFSDARKFLRQELHESDVILLDLMMPNLDGIEVIRNLAKKNCLATLVLISGYDSGVLHASESLARDYGLRVIGNFSKPISIKKLTGLLSSTQHTGKRERAQIITESFADFNQGEHPLFIPDVDDLLSAIRNKQLLLYYQPQLYIKTSSLAGVEALVRWEHPSYGMIYPAQFIKLAEQTEVIEALTAEVIELAVAQSSLWKKQGYDIKISINISARNITSLLLPEQLRTLVKVNKIDPASLVLEVTESALMAEYATPLDILTRLRLKGFQLSIDDFGTGFSSLSQLHRIPFTELKVDQSFVMNMIDDVDSYAIVETCIMLGHKLNMEVVAEGVDDKQAWDLLGEMGCDIGQGYLIAKPMTAKELIHWTGTSRSI